jgi:hypothetical protein
MSNEDLIMTPGHNMATATARSIIFSGCLMISVGVLADCIPEGVEKDVAQADLPALLPANFPKPADYIVMNASEGAADEYNPYPYATAELLVPGDTDSVFAFYEKSFPAAGYRIVMWEKDDGATGFRVRGDTVDQVTVSINSYDCRVLVGINASLLP